MATATTLQTSVPTAQEQIQKIQQLRDLFADAPELGKKALENALHELKSQASDLPPPVESAGRVGARLGKVSELTIIVPLIPGGAKTHLLAFADHAAEFYAGSGNDRRRALELARANAANRPTLRAITQAQAIARSSRRPHAWLIDPRQSLQMQP
jgi:hypothetical protein